MIAQTRDALRDFVNGLGLTPAITAASSYGTLAGLDELAGGRILVVPREVSATLETHDAAQEFDATVDVVIQFKGADVSPATLDPYQAMAEQIDAAVIGQQLSTGMTCVGVLWPNGAFDAKQLEEERTFYCTLSCQFRAA